MIPKTKTRFRVLDARNGKDIEDAFVLLPVVDSAARVALAAYAEATTNVNVARFIRAWLKEIHDERSLLKENFYSDRRVLPGGRGIEGQ